MRWFISAALAFVALIWSSAAVAQVTLVLA
jgi:hypothetical protein